MGLPSTQPAGSSSLSSSSYRHNNNHHGEEDDFKKPFDSSATATTAHGSVAAPPFVAPTSSSLSTYLSLVQQYLSVFMVDNATFFAERCAAEHPGHPDAVYLLALCYHRSGSPRRARITLEGGGSGSGGGGVVTTSGSSSSSSVAAIAASSPTPAMRYLSARCSYELGDYGRAETALLWECRRHYGRYRGDLSMDDWIAQTTVRWLFFLPFSWGRKEERSGSWHPLDRLTHRCPFAILLSTFCRSTPRSALSGPQRGGRLGSSGEYLPQVQSY